MPFTKIGPDKWRSAGGHIFNDAQVMLYKAHGNKFPSAEEKAARTTSGKTAEGRDEPKRKPQRLAKRPIGA